MESDTLRLQRQAHVTSAMHCVFLHMIYGGRFLELRKTPENKHLVGALWNQVCVLFLL